MATRFSRWGGLAVVGASWIPLWGFLGPASSRAAPPETPQPSQVKTVELKFAEQSQQPSSWYGFMPDADGKIQRPFATPSGQLTINLVGDKLRVDNNGDGKIDDKDAAAVTCKPNELVRIHVVARVGNRNVDYPFGVRVQQSGDSRYLLVASVAMLEGKLGQRTIRVYDGNQDGKFGNEGDRVEIFNASDRSGPQGYGQPWSRTVAMDGRLQRLELSDDASQVKITPYTGPVAEIQLACDGKVQNLSATLQEIRGEQVGQCDGRQAAVFVPGKYRLSGVTFTTGGTNNGRNYLYGYHASEDAAIEVKPGRNVIKVGPPLKMEFTAHRNGDTVEFTAAAINGVAGESYRPSVQPNGDEFFAAFVRVGGKELKLKDLEFS